MGEDEITQEVRVPAGLRPARTALTLQVVKGPRAGEILTFDHSHAVLGRGSQADLRIDDPSLSRMHVRFDRDGDTLAVTDLDSRNGTLVEGTRLQDKRRLKNGDLITLGSVVLRFAIQDATELQVSRDLYEAAVRDRLTGLHNRGYFEDRLAADFAYVKRHGAELAVLLIDLDHFKQVNDEHGHMAGDALLCAAASQISETLRAEDLAARYGGEEFVVLARGSERDGSVVLAERLRARIAAAEVQVDRGVLRATASVGVAVWRKEIGYKSHAELLSAADEALYTAKRAGRNQVCIHRDSQRSFERVDGSYSMHPTHEHVEQIRARPKGPQRKNPP